MTRLQHHNGAFPARRVSRLEIVLLAAGIVTMAFGLLALLGWGFGWQLLASFGANRIPMAPSTAVLFLLYGAAIGLRARSPLGRRAQWGSGVLAGFGILVALLLFVLGWLHIHWSGEHLGLNITGMVGGAPIGQMSLVTAFCFLLSGVSFLTSLSPSATRPWRAALALVSAVVLLGICLVFLLAYGFGTPLLFGGSFIPPTLNTILAFNALGLALMALACRPGSLFRGLPGDDSKPAFSFVLIFVLLAIGIVVAGYAYYRNFERQFRAAAEQQIAAIADLKVGELAQYRKERLGDAAVLHDNPAVIESARRFLASPADADAQRQLQAWLVKYQSHFQYDVVRLLDVQGGTRLSVPAGLPPVSSAVARGASEVLRSGQLAFLDFFRSEHDQRVYLAVLVPLFDDAAGHRPLGVIVLRIDPASYLYPFISRWPLPSETAETLLVRREGNETVFLNELRFQKNTALTLRCPLANTSMPAVKAVLGQQGIVEGQDYRSAPVLAAERAVPDSPWFMVARRDLAEVYTPLHSQLWQVIALVAVLLFGAGAGVGLVWRQQRVRHYRDLAETAEALQESRNLLAQAQRLGRVGGWEIDLATGQLTWTETVYDIHELDGTGRPTVDQGINYYTPESRPIIERAVQRAIEQGEPFDLELEIITAKGNRRCVHAVGQADRARGKVSSFFQDITERKEAEQKIHELNAVLEQRVIDRTAQLEAVNKELEAFAYSVSHDLRAPLRAVDGYTRILVDDLGPRLDEEGRRVCSVISESARNMGKLIDDLLAFSRIGRTEMNFSSVDMAALAKAIFFELTTSGERERIGFHVAPLPLAQGDPTLLRQVWVNLIGNAVKFSSKTEWAVIEVSAEDQGGKVVYRVRDNGAGFDMQYASKLFSVFQRLHSAREFEGIGVGLAIVQRIVQRHGGRVWAEGTTGQGATFYFTLDK